MLVIYTYTTWWQSSLLLQKLTDKADTTAEKLYSLCDKSINVYFRKGGMFYAESVCLSVCLLAGSCKNYWLHLHKDSTTGASVDKEELLNFWKSSASGSEFLKRNLEHCNIGHFSTIWLISLEKLIWSSWIFFQRCIFGQVRPH